MVLIFDFLYVIIFLIKKGGDSDKIKCIHYIFKYILLKKESVNNLYKFNIVVENNKKDNLYTIIMKSKLYGLQSLLCEKRNMELDDYDEFLYLYISQSKGLYVTYEDFYDAYSREEINEMYVDCIVQQYMKDIKK